ncbi:hypothetical protein EDEG_03157 [Edhazardia aedis USNM 41457]|uniref:Glycoside hydrolase family 19 catalytic domain-containing protein n=1 Tax=Edhazardia aedis (strain USNM 41457) TaxID=1003232 RepID=J9DIH0_EDHAE|nr:hypothetical protein EDEG_03157 [Edhazardia aedis USNM 41457]|eukprot:EJW02415.1 hypothetical protein EDEG_03157 [Edhazardia aedis USNM 41457]
MLKRNTNYFLATFADIFNSTNFISVKYTLNGPILRQVIRSLGFKLNETVPYDYIAFILQQSFRSLEECAFLLSHILYDSKGLNLTEKKPSNTDNTKNKIYNNKHGLPGLSYHHRGVLHVCWPQNYMKLGELMGIGDLLWRQPDHLLDVVFAVKAAVAWWDVNVTDNIHVGPTNFGSTADLVWTLKNDYSLMEEDREARFNVYRKVCSVLRVRRRAVL